MKRININVSSVTFEIENIDEIKKKLEEFEDQIVEEFLNDWADAILFESKRLLAEGKIEGSNDPLGGAFDRGGLSKSGHVIKNKDLEREVVFGGKLAPYAAYIEYGTAPHHPPVAPLIAWAKRNKFKNPKNVAWAIAKKMEKEGTSPKPFLRQAVMIVEQRLPEIWQNTLSRF